LERAKVCMRLVLGVDKQACSELIEAVLGFAGSLPLVACLGRVSFNRAIAAGFPRSELYLP
jgi:hypothetical protein